MVLFFSSSASFVSRTAQKQGLLVSRTALLLLVSRTASCLFQEPLKEMVLFFFCLFQEPLVSRTQRNGAVLLLLVSRTASCLFQEPLKENGPFLNSTSSWTNHKNRLFQEPLKENKRAACFKNPLFQEFKEKKRNGAVLFFFCLFQEPLAACFKNRSKKRKEKNRKKSCCSFKRFYVPFLDFRTNNSQLTTNN